ncbi:MAG: hypothetical protein AABY46_03950 [Nitrospirota bacterium]
MASEHGKDVVVFTMTLDKKVERRLIKAAEKKVGTAVSRAFAIRLAVVDFIDSQVVQPPPVAT